MSEQKVEYEVVFAMSSRGFDGSPAWTGTVVASSPEEARRIGDAVASDSGPDVYVYSVRPKQ